MAGQTLLQLRTRVLQRVDMVNSQFVTTAEVNQLVNTAGARLRDILITAYEDYYVTKATPFSLVAGKEAYDLVTDCGIADFEKLQQVFLINGSGASLARFTLRKFNLRQLGVLNNPQLTALTIAPPLLFYRLVGNTLYLEPLPTGGLSGWQCEIWYVPQYTQLVNDTDTLDLGVVFGWDEYIANNAAMQIRIKEESDISQMLTMQQEFEHKLEGVLQARDISEAARVVDVEADGWRSGGIYYGS